MTFLTIPERTSASSCTCYKGTYCTTNVSVCAVKKCNANCSAFKVCVTPGGPKATTYGIGVAS